MKIVLIKMFAAVLASFPVIGLPQIQKHEPKKVSNKLLSQVDKEIVAAFTPDCF